ncbi:hypothetical protein KM043_005397 [Ampulex compressa]|nr:hypothetical protein KM043_005397 [Ampulex compressa]
MNIRPSSRKSNPIRNLRWQACRIRFCRFQWNKLLAAYPNASNTFHAIPRSIQKIKCARSYNKEQAHKKGGWRARRAAKSGAPDGTSDERRRAAASPRVRKEVWSAGAPRNGIKKNKAEGVQASVAPPPSGGGAWQQGRTGARRRARTSSVDVKPSRRVRILLRRFHEARETRVSRTA